MMKIVAAFFIALAALGLASATCNKTARTGNCYKARLEIKGICMNYVIKVLEGDLNALPLEKTWTDEATGKTHQNVFGLGNPCDFPDLLEGQEFYFTLNPSPKTDCAVCEAYRPTPKSKNNITVSQTPCP